MPQSRSHTHLSHTPPFLPQPLNWFATPSAHILISRICCKASNLMHLKSFRKVSDNNRDWLWQRRAGRGAWHCVWGRAAERGVLRVGGLKTQLANEIIAKRFKHAKWQHLAQSEGERERETRVFPRRKSSLFRLQIKSKKFRMSYRKLRGLKYKRLNSFWEKKTEKISN